jgi:crotonobetainyl-CoA:carnitine CoA-transferase CaiB-like acyl-CoA transferase
MGGGALAGVTVLDLTRMLPGPFCTALLADHGARVIQLEAVRPTPLAGLALPPLRRHKESLALDLKQPAGKAIIERLLGTADVLVEGFRPGVADRLGLGFQSLHARHPRLIVASLSGFGQHGARRHEVGHDLNYLALSGVLDLLTPAGEPPQPPGLQLADLAGALHAANGVLLALVERQRTGKGQQVDVAMTDSAAALLALSLTFQQSGMPFRLEDSLLGGAYACYNTYRTADDRHLAVGALEAPFFGRLCQLLGIPESAAQQYNADAQPALRHQLAERFASQPLAHWLERFEGQDVAVSPVRSFDEALNAPDLQDRGVWRELSATDRQTLTVPGSPIRLASLAEVPPRYPPARGEDTDRLLRELGYNDDQIDELRRTNVVA